MKILQGRWLLSAVAVTGMLLLQGCAQHTAVKSEGESFAAAAEGNTQFSELKSEAPIPTDAPVSESAMASAEIPASSSPDNSPKMLPAATPGAVQSAAPPKREAEDKTAVTATPSSTPQHNKIPAPTLSGPVAASTGSSVNKKGSKEGSAAASVALQSPAASLKPSTAPVQNGQDKVNHLKVNAESSSTDNTPIDWNGFFDGSDQTRPSERFWDLSGSRVSIKGFMGEVLSFEKNWFLLIPEPGAECPFDNGDETYWNKIMIVFVPEGSKLRHTSEPLEITGRLDVGIKIDESGYKTMFRLYDASFSPIE
ncbi:hypothetical protein D3C76_432740 [compost metagenome]